MLRAVTALVLLACGSLLGCSAATDPPEPGASHLHPTSGKPTGLPVPPTEHQALRAARSGDDRPPLRDLPALSDPIICTTVNGGEHWHFKGGQPRDNTGDGWMAVVEVNGQRFYWLMMRQGGPGVGGVFYSKRWDGDPTKGWVTELDNSTKALPNFANSPSQANLDTHTFAQNPRSKLVTFVHSSKPGYLWPGVPPTSPKSETYIVQRATTMRGGKTPSSYTRERAAVLMEPDTSSKYEQLYRRGTTYQGSSCEPSLVVAPPFAILFWEHKTWGPADWTGQIFKGRIHRAWCWLWELDSGGPFHRLPGEGYSFDPEDARLPRRSTNNRDALWGTANVTLRSGVTLNPNDGILHLVYQAGRPQVRADGKPATGLVNKSMGLAHVSSADYGWTWDWDDGNPLFIHQDLPGYVDDGTGNRLNSPFFLFDVDAPRDDGEKGIGWLFFWGNAKTSVNQPGTRLYAMRFNL